MNKFLISNIILGCITSCAGWNNSQIKVENPHYQSYQYNNEKGYEVRFQLKDKKAVPEYVVLNNIRQDIPTNNKNAQGIYSVKVIAETREIQNYNVKGDTRENGIGFRIGKEEVFQPVDFKRK